MYGEAANVHAQHPGASLTPPQPLPVLPTAVEKEPLEHSFSSGNKGPSQATGEYRYKLRGPMGHSHSTFSEQSAVLTLDFLPATSSKSGTASADRSSLANKTEVHTAKGGEPGSSPKPPTVEKSETPPQLASRKAKNRSFSPFGKRRPHLRRISNATLHIAHKSKPSKVVDTRPTAADRRGAKPRVLLAGCANSEEHFGRVDTVMGMTRGLRGKKGLEAVGFEYLMTSCSADQPEGVEIGGGASKNASTFGPSEFPTCVTRLHFRPSPAESPILICSSNRNKFISDSTMYDEIARLCQEYAQDVMAEEGDLVWVTVCDDNSLGEPVRCLVPRGHNLCQPGGQANTSAPDPDSIGHPSGESSPLLLISTGNGKVRAGIFSRAHLMTTGLEPSTALPMVREAKSRGMRCVIPDPNIRGDRNGMETYRRSVGVVFDGLDLRRKSGGTSVGDATHDSEQAMTSDCSCGRSPVYVLAHSASGSHFVRHLRDHSPFPPPSGDWNLPRASGPVALRSRIKAIAFTDSTHNIQWTRKDPSHKDLENLLEGEATIYLRVEPEEGVRSAATRREGIRRPIAAKHSGPKDHCYTLITPRESAGTPADCDQFWCHRFGDVRTVWAGTGEHSLTNWTGHKIIWEHFDRYRTDPT